MELSNNHIASPIAYDRFGNMYVLASDGSTYKVPNIGYQCDEKIINFGYFDGGAWFCSNKNILIYEDASKSWHSRSFDVFSFRSRLADYSTVFGVDSADKNCVLINGNRAKLLVSLEGGNVKDYSLESDCIFCSGLVSNKGLLIAGMESRKILDNCLESWGKPVILKLADGYSIENTCIDFNGAISLAEELNGFEIEAVLDMCEAGNEKFLVASLMPKLKDMYLQSEDVYVEEQVLGDSLSTAFFSVEDGVSLIKTLHGQSYTGSKIKVGGGVRLYCIDSSLCVENTSINLTVINVCYEGKVTLLEGEIKGIDLPKGSRINFVRIWFKAGFGYYGVVGYAFGLSEAGYLLRSEDGVKWDADHPLLGPMNNQ